MVNEKDLLIKEIKDAISFLSRNHDIRESYLFGSYAKGNQKKYSDVDIAIVLGSMQDQKKTDEFFEIFHEMQNYNSLFEPICFQQNKFNDEDDLVRNIKKNGIKIL
jgi:predicted nucleotidyltransferase